MAHLNILRNDHFSLVNLIAMVNSAPYLPRRIGQMGLFQAEPIDTTEFTIEQLSTQLKLLQTSERGEDLPEKVKPPESNIKQFDTIRFGEKDRLTAARLRNVRETGTESELEQVQRMLDRMVNGLNMNEGLLADIELTREYHRMGALQGLILDADGTTVLYDFFQHFGITQLPYFNFNWPAAAADEGQIRVVCNQIHRAMARASKGTIYDGIHVFTGDNFYDGLTQNKETRSNYLRQGTLLDLEDGNGPFEGFRYGRTIFENYRGTDNNSTVAVPSDECIIFPTGSGMFRDVMAPGEALEDVNTEGRPEYVEINLEQRERPRWADVEAVTYGAQIPLKPQMLFRGRTQP